MHAIPTGKPWYYYLSHILMLAGTAILGAVVFGLIAVSISAAVYGVSDLETFFKDSERLSQYPGVSFLFFGLTSIGTFLTPAILYPMYLGQTVLAFHRLRWPSSVAMLLLAIVLTFLAFNPVAVAMELNAMIDVSGWGGFGEWLSDNERSNQRIQKEMLGYRSVSGVALSLLVVTVIPAVGEELLFRGVLQRIMQSWAGRHLGIAITAIIFSAIHVEFSGLLPRIFLGLFLGYIFYWTGNLFFPVMVHFLNNAFIVVVAQFYSLEKIEVSEIGNPELWAAALGTLLFAGFLYFFYKLSKSKPRHGEELGEDLHDEPTIPG